jgi:uncharacterized protein (DUF4415 family)
MRDEHDFSNTKPAAEIPALAPRKTQNRDKTRITIIIDMEVFEAFRDRADALGKPYQPMINAALHEYLARERGENLEATLRRVIREELRPSAEV